MAVSVLGLENPTVAREHCEQIYKGLQDKMKQQQEILDSMKYDIDMYEHFRKLHSFDPAVVRPAEELGLSELCQQFEMCMTAKFKERVSTAVESTPSAPSL